MDNVHEGFADLPILRLPRDGLMRRRRLVLRREAVRVLRVKELEVAVGGMVATTSEAEGGGPCPGEYSRVCVP